MRKVEGSIVIVTGASVVLVVRWKDATLLGQRCLGRKCKVEAASIAGKLKRRAGR